MSTYNIVKPLHNLHKRLERLGIDALLFNTSETMSSYNVRYLTGFTGSEAAILITRGEWFLFTDGRYKTQAKQQAPEFRVRVVRNKLDALARTIKAAGVQRLGVEAQRVSYDFIASLSRRLQEVKLVSLNRTFLEHLRIRKTSDEKMKIQRAAHIAALACKEIVGRGLSGKREIEVAAELETEMRRNGAEAVAFESIVASGERSALPHGEPSDRVIGRGELVIIDYGCRLEGYHSDETVTCVTGEPSDKQKKIHNAVYEAHMRALDAAKPGIRAREMDGIARRSITDAGFGNYFLHGLGHGVGLEIHEPPYLSPRGRGVLEQGMVFTIEPGVYLEGQGGVRLESLVYLDRQGPELLSEMPKDLIPAG
ncbi:MAG TPA: Xaa-Pro peptidase family protein [Desulfomonilaceae bacterium]|nr:Xaa-Pro peptidase family protein [Desulfomonilaceae bacterium]